MDLEIGGASAIVCASSKGLGFACAAELAREGASVVICGRHADTLEDARRQIAAPPEGLEPSTYGLEVRRSIPLSYGGLGGTWAPPERVTGVEPA